MFVYPISHIIHLFCAIIFVGGVMFETFILSALHQPQVSREARKECEKAISRRATRVMPWVVGALFLSGLSMAHRYLDAFAHPLASSFNFQLVLKVLLAFSILAHFIIAVSKMKRGSLTVAWSRYIHRAVLIQMILIVFLAKAMFYFTW